MQSAMVKAAIVFGVVTATMVLASCGSNWRMHKETAQAGVQPTLPQAPDWVKLRVPQTDGRVYFVGRSHTPDLPRGNKVPGSTPDNRVGYTSMDERDAVQSARTDVYDQIRQRLAPRNMGTAANIASLNVDSGTCIDCGKSVALVRTPVQTSCNEDCYASKGSTWPSTGQKQGCATGLCNGAGSQPTMFAGTCGGCGAKCGVPGTAGSPVTLVDALTEMHRAPDYLPIAQAEIARDINVMNIGIDSVMPAMLSGLREEEVYFEKWSVHEGDDTLSRPLATGGDEWESYKCWILCSMPQAEFDIIADQFRSTFNELYTQAKALAQADRNRRMQWEDTMLKTQLTWQLEERKWNRADEEIARNHAVGLDKDREALPGRRFTVVGSGR